jgi:hypothetical protein
MILGVAVAIFGNDDDEKTNNEHRITIPGVLLPKRMHKPKSEKLTNEIYTNIDCYELKGELLDDYDYIIWNLPIHQT